MSKINCNLDLVVDLMNYSPRGAICQAFIMEAIMKYAEACSKADPATFDSGFMNGQAWVDVAKDVKQRCEAFYGRK